MSDLTKQQALERLAPLLLQLGADPKAVLGELVRTWEQQRLALICEGGSA